MISIVSICSPSTTTRRALPFLVLMIATTTPLVLSFLSYPYYHGSQFPSSATLELTTRRTITILNQQIPSTDSWYTTQSSLPFECTSCGKCCQTKGSVWMSPQDVRQASDWLQMEESTFISRYASHTLDPTRTNQLTTTTTATTATSTATTTNSNTSPWVRLRNNSQEHCIFLTIDKKCQIYPVRPIQCKTYPFWTNVMSSKQSWNDEVRLPYDDDDTTSTTTNSNDDLSPIPYWTSDMGGCEGMTEIVTPWSTPRSVSSNVITSTTAGVDPSIVTQQLILYEQNEQQFPNHGTVEAIGDTTESCWDDDE